MRFIPTLTLSLSLMISACGGSGGSGSDEDSGSHNGANPGSGGSYTQGKYRDCSLDQWEDSSFPFPEYPGRYLETPVTNFMPDQVFNNRTGKTADALLTAVNNSDEGAFHQGPSWSGTSNGLTTTVGYSDLNGLETWTIRLTPQDPVGYDYGHAYEYTFRQLANCRLEYEAYDPASDELRRTYWAEAGEAELVQYTGSGEMDRSFKTRINEDGSGTTVETYHNTTLAHPVTIYSWDTDENITLTQECEDESNYTCIGPSVTIGG